MNSAGFHENLLFDFDLDNDGYADGNILADGAWCYSVGRNDIVVGVIDDKIDFTHEDLRNEENGYIISGWDFFQNTEINDESLIGNEFHGTRVAGVIGALRNNGLGVVGIAGGDYRAVENTHLSSEPTAPLPTDVVLGVQMNAYMVGQGITIFSEQAAEALLMSVTNDFEMNWGDACHIINNSWGTTAEGLEYPWRLLTDYDFEIAKNYWFANRNGVVNFTARGNQNTNGASDRVVYPSCFYDHWLISVGASDVDGKDSQVSLDGRGIDFLGPEHSTSLHQEWSVMTTTFDIGQAVPYANFSGTSSGTPHAAGVGALMLSYYNQSGPSPVNLFPSDVEQLMQMSSSNYDTPGAYSFAQGWGLVKAQRALEYLEAPNYVLGHYNEEFDTSQLQLIAQSDILTIPIVSGDGFELSEGDYLVDRYMIEEQVTIVSPPNTIATSAWARPEATNCYPDLFVSGSNNYLFLDEFCEVSNLSNLSSNQLTLRGFVYHVLSEVSGGVVDLWFPSEGFFSIPYTVHFMDNTPISTLELDQHSFELFPNPVVDVLQIKGLNFDSALRFEIMSVNGAKVLSGTTMGVISLSGLSPGLYIARFYLEDTLVSKKIIKL